MDLTTIGGIMFGLFLILGSIVMGGSASSFVDIPSLAITIGGSASAILITYPISKVKITMAVAKNVFFSESPNFVPLYTDVVELATVARRDGILALEAKVGDIENDFLKKGLQMMVDGNPPEVISSILEKDIDNTEDRHLLGQSLFKNMGSYAPAFGMIGTLIGLVQMLQNLSDPSAIGGGMATALLTTLYGAFFANLFCIPIAGKLEQRSNEEILMKNMILEGILSIHAGDSPRIVGDKVKVFMQPSEREQVAE